MSFFNFCQSRRAQALAIIILCLRPVFAAASGLEVHEQSAAALAQSYAGAAAGAAGLSSLYWNPATLTQHDGINVTGSLSALFPYAVETTNGAATSPFINPAAFAQSTSNVLHAQALPSAAISAALNEKIWIGLGFNAPFGLSADNPRSWAGSIYGVTSSLRSEDITPTIAIKINPRLSVAAGVQMAYVTTDLTSLALPMLTSLNTITAHGWGVGFTLGASYYLTPSTLFGIGYRSQLHEHLSGTQTLPSLAINNASISTVLVLPDMVSLGLSQKINDHWQIDFGYQFTHWDVFNRFPIQGGYSNESLNFVYRNSFMASVGMAYHWSERLILKWGSAYESSPIDASNRSVRVPDNHRLWASLGISYHWSDRLSVDTGFAHVFVSDGTIDIAGTHPAYNTGWPVYAGTTKTHADVLSLGVTYRFP